MCVCLYMHWNIYVCMFAHMAYVHTDMHILYIHIYLHIQMYISILVPYTYRYTTGRHYS